MKFRSWLTLALGLLHPSLSAGLLHQNAQGQELQNIVTYDEHSLMVNGERLMIMSGEFHPFRVPNPALWLDVLQKTKALGFNTVSFYVDWALVEGKPGDFSADGVFSLDPLFEAAAQAGIYLIARPGPYINAESSGGGLPGWIHRVKGNIRTNTTGFEEATVRYLEKIGPLVAKGQITNGGPVILVQPENEYSRPAHMLSKDYMQLVIDTLRDTGTVVPLISDDSVAFGHFAPGTGEGEVDIYGHNGYPLAFDCSQPEIWSGLKNQYFPYDFHNTHMAQSPSTPYSILEWQAGSLDTWAGPGYDMCSDMTNHEYYRVFYKTLYGFGVKIFNLYMLFGGTNWGNMGHAYGYTSYDYGAAIKEDRTLTREKYSEMKLQANFFKVSPDYLIAQPQNTTNGTFASTEEISVTELRTSSTCFWVIRHVVFDSHDTTSYKLTLPTSEGEISIPQLGGSLELHGRDAKIMVTDYPVGSFRLLYSTAEVFTWQQYEDSTILVLFGGPEPLNELSVQIDADLRILEGDLSQRRASRGTVIQWETQATSRGRLVFQIGELTVYIIDRNSAYNLWVLDIPTDNSYASKEKESVIVSAGYLVRNASITDDILHLTGDINSTTTLEVIGAPSRVGGLSWNSEPLPSRRSQAGGLTAALSFELPQYELPDLTSLSWKVIDTLPEVSGSYDDKRWTVADHTDTNNTERRNLTTPVSLYGTDYGYNTGALIYRGHFTGNGQESNISLTTQGGKGYCSSVWLNDQFLDVWVGDAGGDAYTHSISVSALESGRDYVLTVVVDQNGLDQSGPIGDNMMKNPRGILDYEISGHRDEDIAWKFTGNLGGEDYKDRVRGPLNEGGLFAERRGYHLPGAPFHQWSDGSPMDGIEDPSIAFFATTLELDMPEGWDIPLSFTFDNDSSAGASRVQLFVNGWHYGKFASNLGPQFSFPVPQGVLNYHGSNYIALSLWALEETGARVAGLRLEPSAQISSGFGKVPLAPQNDWKKRCDSY